MNGASHGALSIENERSYLLNWLLQLEECTKSSSAESLGTLRELASSIQIKADMSDDLQSLILKVQIAAQQRCYNPKLHEEAKKVYNNMLQEEEYNLKFWEEQQDQTPQRMSPCFSCRRQLFKLS